MDLLTQDIQLMIPLVKVMNEAQSISDTNPNDDYSRHEYRYVNYE